jgi:hypothetical protein
MTKRERSAAAAAAYGTIATAGVVEATRGAGSAEEHAPLSLSVAAPAEGIAMRLTGPLYGRMAQ